MLTEEETSVSAVERRSAGNSTAVPWQPKSNGEETTSFVLPPDLSVAGKVRAPRRVPEPGQHVGETDLLEDLLKNAGSESPEPQAAANDSSMLSRGVEEAC